MAVYRDKRDQLGTVEMKKFVSFKNTMKLLYRKDFWDTLVSFSIYVNGSV